MNNDRKKTLHLSKETLRNLQPRELRAAAGGNGTVGCLTATCNTCATCHRNTACLCTPACTQ